MTTTAPAPPSEYYEHRTTVQLVVPAAGGRDLYDPITRRTVIPETVELELVRLSTPDSDREWAHVTVGGPRRLKSGGHGKPITSLGWEAAVIESYGGCTCRPLWLADLLVEHMPDGWSRTLLDLPTT